MTRTTVSRLLLILLLVLPAVIASTGCEDVDWDWESRWWREPTRRVKPDRSQRPPMLDSEVARLATEPQPPTRAEPTTMQPASPPPPPRQSPPPPPRQEPPRAVAQAGPDELFETTPPPGRTEPIARAAPPPAQPASPPQPQARVEPPRPKPQPMQPQPAAQTPRVIEPSRAPVSPSPSAGGAAEPAGFYQLYLVSAGASNARAGGGEARVQLRHASARPAAQVLAQLHVPVGVGGGDDQQYLIYQDRAQWQAAQAIVSLIDVDPKSSGDGLAAGVACMLALADGGAIPARDDAAKCKAVLAAAAAGGDARGRWMAHVLAGRLAADQMYEYDAARQHYDAAAEAAGAGSLEALTARWWRAESLDLEGNTAAAREAYAAIERDFASHPNAQAVQRAKANQTGRRR